MANQNKKIKALLIGESSAGLTAVEIYNGDELVWSTNYFSMGATVSHYAEVNNKQVQDDMVNCEDYLNYDGCDYDDDGKVVCYSDAETAGIVARYDRDGGFRFGTDDYGQTGDVVINGSKISDIVKPIEGATKP